MAIIGASGSGKSSLLNILSGNLEITKNIEVKGEVLLNNHKMDYTKYKNIIGFVM